MVPEDDLRLETENLDLRRLLAQAGIHAAEHKLLSGCSGFCSRNCITG
jgi:hypothetical protein